VRSGAETHHVIELALELIEEMDVVGHVDPCPTVNGRHAPSASMRSPLSRRQMSRGQPMAILDPVSRDPEWSYWWATSRMASTKPRETRTSQTRQFASGKETSGRLRSGRRVRRVRLGRLGTGGSEAEGILRLLGLLRLLYGFQGS